MDNSLVFLLVVWNSHNCNPTNKSVVNILEKNVFFCNTCYLKDLKNEDAIIVLEFHIENKFTVWWDFVFNIKG